MNDLQRKIHMCDPLMDGAGTDDIDVIAHEIPDIRLRQSARDLDQELPLPPLLLSLFVVRSRTPLFPVFAVTPTPLHPLLLQRPGRHFHLLGAEVVEHDDVGAGGDGLVRFGDRSAFHFDFDGEARGGLGGVDGRRDGSGRGGPDVVVFEHRHCAGGALLVGL